MPSGPVGRLPLHGALALLAALLLPQAAEARQGPRGGGAAPAAHGGSFAARSAARPAARQPAAPPVRPLQPAGATWTPNPGAPAVITPHPGAQVLRLRGAGTAYRPGYAAGWGQPAIAAPQAAPADSTPPRPVAAPPQATAAPCPPPPPQVWIGGRLWIPDHQSCDGSIVAGRWGAESPFTAVGH